MDRVKLSNEPRGSATYYMGAMPEDYGDRLYEMDDRGDARLGRVLMDIGMDRSEPSLEIKSEAEFDALVNDTGGRTIFSCEFEVAYEGLDIKVILDFQARRITLNVNPELTLEEKQKLANFFEILTNPDYYKEQEMEEVEEELRAPGFIKTITTIVAAVVVLSILISLTDSEEMVELKHATSLIVSGVTLFYATFIAINRKRIRIKRKRK